MAKRVTILFLLLLCSLSFTDAEKVYAEGFFMDCEAAFKLKEFSVLQEFFDKHSDEPRPEQCFRLNNSEFLVIITDTARAGQGLYFVNIKRNKMEIDGGYALMGVEREFLGKNKKRYVLLANSNLGGGSYSYGYSILNLVPRTYSGKPYIVYSLFYVSEDPESGLCGEMLSTWGGETTKTVKIKEGTTEQINSYKILNEGTENVTIIFNITEQNCKTLVKKPYTKTFKIVNGEFKAIN